MTAPDRQIAAGTSHVVVDGAALADLELVLAGVQLPWPHLGGDLAPPDSRVVDGRFTVALHLGDGVLEGLDGGDLVLTDPTSLPLARLEAVTLTQATEGGETHGVSTVTGTLTAWPSPATPSTPVWVRGRPGMAVVVAQRPLLRGEMDDLVAAVGPAGRVRVLVATGPTPDGIPGLVLLETVRSVVAGRDRIEVDAVPLYWRGPLEDAALVDAIDDRVGSPTALLAATDPRWVAVAADVLDGRVPAEVDAAAAPALTAWRPPADGRGVVVFFTGFSGSGKSSIADALVEHVRTRRTITLLDGDVVRTMLSSGLGFDRAGRDLNIRRIGYVAAEIARHHGMAVCAPIAPFAETRAAVRQMVEQVGDFVLVHVATPLEECERRDPKGLYARARTGEIPDFTGISSPYEVPTDADLVLDTTGRTLEQSLGEVLDLLRTTGWIRP